MGGIAVGTILALQDSGKITVKYTANGKEEVLELDKNTKISLLDTPGHVDFSSETERVLSVLDYAILVISGSEGVQREGAWRI